MRIFITGASGWIGTAVTAELLAAGHDVVGLARSAASADRITALGGTPWRGSLEDPESLRAGAAESDGVVHLGYHHDFSQMAEAARLDRAAIETLGDALAGSGRPLLIASGALGLADGRPGTETDRPDPASHPRVANAPAALDLVERDVRSVVVRFAPTVHGAGDHGFMAVLSGIARERGVSAYVGDGANRWPAVHRSDAADLVRRAVEGAPAGSVLHAIAEEGVRTRDIAQALGESLSLPVAPIAPAEAPAHFGWMGMFFGADLPTRSDATRRELGWTPTHPGLLEDILAGYYA